MPFINSCKDKRHKFIFNKCNNNKCTDDMKLEHRDLISLLIPVVVFEREDEHEEVKKP